MTQQELIAKEMSIIAQDKRIVFIGYNTAKGHQMYKTLPTHPRVRIIETPVAENLMTGIAMGMSMTGYIPMLCFERMDFTLAAADALLNHMDKLPILSKGQFNFPVIIRCIIGHDKPLDPGPQHKGDYTDIFTSCHNIQVYEYEPFIYLRVLTSITAGDNRPRMVIERKSEYQKVIPLGRS